MVYRLFDWRNCYGSDKRFSAPKRRSNSNLLGLSDSRTALLRRARLCAPRKPTDVLCQGTDQRSMRSSGIHNWWSLSHRLLTYCLYSIADRKVQITLDDKWYDNCRKQRHRRLNFPPGFCPSMVGRSQVEWTVEIWQMLIQVTTLSGGGLGYHFRWLGDGFDALAQH